MRGRQADRQGQIARREIQTDRQAGRQTEGYYKNNNRKTVREGGKEQQ